MKLFNMLENVSLSEGFSWNLKEDYAPTSGFAVSTFKSTELVLDHCPSALEIADYALDNAAKLLGDSEFPVVLGLWADNGNWYIDVSTIVPDKDTALDLGRKSAQIAVFDIANFETIYCN